MFEFMLEDAGIVQRIKEIKEYYKKKDQKEEEERRKSSDSILEKVFKIYPGM
jgi:hypothetical protein